MHLAFPHHVPTHVWAELIAAATILLLIILAHTSAAF